MGNKDDLDSIYCTAHNFEYTGYDARHAWKEQPPKHCKIVMDDKQPMELREAKIFIRDLFFKWLSPLE